MTTSPDAQAQPSWLEAIAVYLKPRVLIVMFLGFSSGLPLALSGATLLVWMRESGVNLAPVQCGRRELYTLYLPPFKAAVTEARVGSIMPAYSELDGVPASKSKLLLTRILREEWGFRGYVFSDYGAIGMLKRFHKTAHNAAEAGKQALEAGMDLEAPGEFGFGAELLKLVQKGEVAVELVDRAVSEGGRDADQAD